MLLETNYIDEGFPDDLYDFQIKDDMEDANFKWKKPLVSSIDEH